jgi:DNA-binding NarL/FixJ family response regulator
MIRVLLVDDEELVRAGLRMILDSADDIEVVDEAGDGADAAMAVRRCQPHVVLMDLRMPRVDGLQAIEELRKLESPPEVIVLTTFDADDEVFRALSAGAAGFLLKDTPPQDLIRAVRQVASGEAVLSPSVTRRLITHVADDDRASRRDRALDRIHGLTARERDVLTAVGAGLTNAEIGRELGMSEATVKSHITHLFQKLDATNRVQLAITAFHAGLNG